MDVPSVRCLIKLCNGKAWLCGAEWRGACAWLEWRAPGTSGEGQRRAPTGRGRRETQGGRRRGGPLSSWATASGGGTRWMMNRAGLPDSWCLNLAQRWWRLRTVLRTQIWDTRRSWFEGSTWPQLSDTAESVHSWEWGLGLLASPSDSSRGARGKNYFCRFPFPVSFSYT